MARAKRLWETSSYFGTALAVAKNSENSIDTSLAKLLIQAVRGTQRRFPPKYIENTHRPYGVLLDH